MSQVQGKAPGVRVTGDRGAGQVRAEEGVKEDDKLGLSPTMESIGLISRGELREASYALGIWGKGDGESL